MLITPTTDYLLGLKGAGHQWFTILGELIDNSLDAGAMRVTIDFSSSGALSVSDDGCGCANVAAMLTLGSHDRQARCRLGRYGLGLKEAATSLWGKTVIDTVRDKTLRSITIDWEELLRSGRWTIADPIIEHRDSPNGTSIQFLNIIRSLKAESRERLLAEIGYHFSPAIRSGVQIVFAFPRGKRTSVTAYQMPPLTNIIEAAGYAAGKEFKLRAGVVQDGAENRYPGFAYTFGHRVVMGPTALGAGGVSVRRIAGVVELSRQWQLTKNKDDVTEHRDELGAAVAELCSDVLSVAHNDSLEFRSAALNAEIGSMLNNALADLAKIGKQKRRKKENESGAILPVNTPRKIRRAAMTQPGDSLRAAASGRISHEWMPLDSGELGRVDMAGKRVQLNENNDFLTRMRESENAGAITAVIALLFADACSQQDDRGQKHFVAAFDDNMRVPHIAGMLLNACKLEQSHEAAIAS